MTAGFEGDLRVPNWYCGKMIDQDSGRRVTACLPDRRACLSRTIANRGPRIPYASVRCNAD